MDTISGLGDEVDGEDVEMESKMISDRGKQLRISDTAQASPSSVMTIDSVPLRDAFRHAYRAYSIMLCIK